MKRLSLLLLFLSCCRLVAADAPVTMPNDVTLTTGSVLRNVKVLRWEKDRVVLRHAGGVDPVAFSLFKIPAPEDLPAIRAASETSAKPGATALPVAAQQRTLTGQVMTTQRGVFKFSGTTVRAYPALEFDPASGRERAKLPENFKNMMPPERSNAWAHAWPDALSEVTPVATATTDEDGNYSMMLPPGTAVFLVCTALHRTTHTVEQFTWVVRPEITATKVDLNDSNRFAQAE